jgi:hypothetical protein
MYAGGLRGWTGTAPEHMASLAMSREKQPAHCSLGWASRQENAAVSLNAAREAILKCLPRLRGEALSMSQIFDRAMIPTKTTENRALKALLDAGQIKRLGKGVGGDPYLYWRGC